MKENLYTNEPIRDACGEDCICKNCVRILWYPSECIGEGFKFWKNDRKVISECTGFLDYRSQSMGEMSERKGTQVPD